MSLSPPGLEDPRYARHAWTRFRYILRAMSATAMACGLAVAGLLWWKDGALPLPFILLTVGGVWATIMMAAVLMGLMFLSHGTGHDDQVEDLISKEVLERHEK